MKQTEENGKQKVFSTTMGLCALCTFFSSQLTFLQVNRHIVLPPSQTALIHIISLGGGGEKTKTYGLECKTAFGRVLKPTIYIYTFYTFLPLYILYSTHNVFSFVHPSVGNTHLTLKKRNQRKTFPFTQQLTSY